MTFPLAVGIGWCVPSLVEVVVNHGDTTRPRLSYFGLVRREFDRGGIFPFLPRYRRLLGVCTADFAVYMHRRLPLHGIGDMAVNIKRGCRGHMAYGSGAGQLKDGTGGCRGHMAYGCRERFHIHTVLQRHGSKGVTQIVKAHLFTARPFQDQL